MRRCLILTVMLLFAQLNGLFAQTTFTAPDTVCIRQPITLTPKDTTASSYYWSFCSGWLMNRPTGNFLGYTFGINNSFDIETGLNSDGNYFGFYINRTVPELIRLDYGSSLTNIPTVTNLGNLSGTIPADANSLFLMQDGAGKFVMFATGGSSVANSSLFRMDFGTSLSNKPNCVNMGNLGGLLNAPRGFFVAKEGPYWFGFAANAQDNKLIRFDFGTNISNTPNPIDLGNPGSVIDNPSDMAGTRDKLGNWHLFITNFISSGLAHIGFGSSLAAIPAGSGLAVDSLSAPSSIILAKDCGEDYLFISNFSRNYLTRVVFSDLSSLTFTDQTLISIPGIKNTLALSHFLREKDNLYTFVINSDNSLGVVNFANCVSSSLRSSTEKYPPSYTYATPGTYNVFLSMNEGTPQASMECFLVEALPIPAITIVDDTTICQGDTASLWGIAFGTDTLRWTPSYNITQTKTAVDALYTKVWPDYTRPYHFIAEYPNGCIVDSAINVTVSKVHADAGVDRTVEDGAYTVLGGPMTSEGVNYIYSWSPTNYLDNYRSTNPTSTPSTDISYVLTVQSALLGCVAHDTVVVKIGCGDIYLPNAFTPGDHSDNNDYFGLKNRNIVQLNYFRVYDRWGKEVFSTTDLSTQWDGKVDGVDCPYGVYAWVVDGFCASGKRISKSGNVTLLR
ncbi:gliding motility-associated C-terminal domain-containing protein [Rurimicrobium arvi]